MLHWPSNLHLLSYWGVCVFAYLCRGGKGGEHHHHHWKPLNVYQAALSELGLVS